MIRNLLPSSLAPSLSLCLLITSPAVAQIIPDKTLPVNSVVTPQGNIKVIDGGTTAGSNLFHSFQEFSIGTGETALFNNALNIQNIFTRITGTSASNIDGLLKAYGNANLFLLNPNGIIFGPNAKLEIGGSFISSTASSIKFADGSEFSAINPQSTALLSITVPLGLQFPGMPANIINQANLQGTPGKTIALVGGDITLNGGQLTAQQGLIELGSVGGNSLVSLNPTANGWTLGYGGINNFGNIQLLSQSKVSASGSSGEIFVRAKDLTVTDGSKISVETANTENAGTINVQADTVTVSGASPDGQKFSTIAATSNGSGDSGNINITTNQLIARDGGNVSVTASSSGKGGNLTVNASELVEVSGASPDGQNFSTIAATSNGSGDSGNINITTNQLIARDGGDVSVTAFDSGKGGNLTVNAAESVALIGARTSPDGKNFSRSGLFAATEGTESGGDLTINTPKLQVLDGARVSVSTRGPGQDPKLGGQGGNLFVNAGAGEIELSGTSPDGRFISGLFALSGEERPKIPDPSIATGNAGNITIQTGQLTIRDGAQVSAATVGTGNAGNITVKADTINITGASTLSKTFSTLAATSSGRGNSGDIEINTRQLSVTDGADVSVTAFGEGSSGKLTVNASDLIELTGSGTMPSNPSNFSRSGLFAATEGTQNGGDLTVNTSRLVVKDGARISVSTRGPGENGTPGGKGGDLTINASDEIDLSGTSPDGQFISGLFALSGEARPNISETAATGPSGNLTITTGLLSIRNGAQVSASAKGSGAAGDLQIQASSIKLENGAEVSASASGSGAAGDLKIQARSIKLENGSIKGETVVGNGANITLQVQNSLQLLGNSQISTKAGESGNGGNIKIGSDTLAILGNSRIKADAGREGGQIKITTQGKYVVPDAITSSSALGTQFNGIVTINTPNVNPTQGLINQPPSFLNPENQVAQGCGSQQAQNTSKFFITGRGGLPPSPTEPLSSEVVRVNETASRSPSKNSPRVNQVAQLPRPATGLVVNTKGEMVLTADVPNLTGQSSLLPTANCHVR